jgi:transcriptional regulator with XRE-family HTH domain
MRIETRIADPRQSRGRGTSVVSPLIRRRRLASELRSLREQSGWTSQELAQRAGMNRSKISRFETADRAATVADVTTLLDALSVTGDQWHELVQMTKDAGERGWWATFPVGDRQAVYADLEHGAAIVREYASFVVPGLLQLPEYTRSRAELSRLQELFPPTRTEGAVDRAVEAKQMRQRMLRRPNGPRYEAIIDESAICRPAAPAGVMRDQLLYLADLDHDERVTVRVLPRRAHMKDYWLPRSPFTLYEFNDGDPAAAVVETETTDLIYTTPPEVDPYADLYGRIAAAALSTSETVALLREEATGYEKGERG